MKIYLLSFILSLCFVDAKDETLDHIDPTLNIEIDESCNYTMTLSMKHFNGYPLPGGPDDCNPAAPAIASDGLPFLVTRFNNWGFPEEAAEITGFYSVSFDFNSCGHPPLGIFTIPHYDWPIYRLSSDYRFNGPMKECLMDPAGGPICDFKGNPAGNT